MKLFQHFLQVIRSVYGSADPNLFGSNKRRKEKKAVANNVLMPEAENTQNEIDALQASNPFDSAAAKSAMKTATRNARQYQTRAANMMGGNASAEAIVASQQVATEGMGAAAGQIATGAEAIKSNQLNNLRSLKAGQLGAYANQYNAGVDERGSGWNTFFQGIDSLGNLASGAGQAWGAISQGKPE